jgi:hypothetical protein
MARTSIRKAKLKTEKREELGPAAKLGYVGIAAGGRVGAVLRCRGRPNGYGRSRSSTRQAKAAPAATARQAEQPTMTPRVRE